MWLWDRYHTTGNQQDRIVQVRVGRSYRIHYCCQIVSYMGFSVREKEIGNDAVQHVCVVKWSPNITQGSWSWTASFHGRGGGGSAVSWSLPRDHFDVWMVSRAPALSWPRSDSVNTYSKSQVASESRALFGQNVGILFQFVIQYRTFYLHLFPASSLLRLRPLHLTHIFKVAKVTPLFSPKVAKIPSDLS